MLGVVRKYFKWLEYDIFGPPKLLSPAEKFAQSPYAEATTPDELIAATVIESFAKDFDNWNFIGEFHQRHSCSAAKTTVLENHKKNLKIEFTFKETVKGDSYSTIYKFKVNGCIVNGLRLENAAYKKIYKSWAKLVVAVACAKAEAEAAKKRMEENEKKWNLAENLLGMKRLSNGALVPKEYDEGAMQ